MKRSYLRKQGKSDTAKIKRNIQALLRSFAISRDGGCVLRNYPETGACSEILQAEHLVSRQHSKYFGDTRNIVCLCQRHHIFWKPTNSRQYWELIEKIIGKERWEWVKLAEQDKHPWKPDWKLVELEILQKIKEHE